MTIDEASQFFASLDTQAQIRLLAAFGFELTVRARGTYGVDGEDVTDPVTLRRVNEVLHRVVGHLSKLLGGDPARYPDDVIVRIMLDERDPRMHAELEAALQRAIKYAA